MNRDPACAPAAMATIEEVAVRLGVSVQTVARLVKRGKFPQPLRLSARHLRWPVTAVDKYLKRLQTAAAD